MTNKLSNDELLTYEAPKMNVLHFSPDDVLQKVSGNALGVYYNGFSPAKDDDWED